MKLLISFIVLLLLSCTGSKLPRNSTPEQIVESFIRVSAEVKSPEDRQKLAAFCQGRMRKAFDALSAQAFAISYVNQPLIIKSWKILDTAIDGNLARVHYQIEVQNPQGQDPTQEISEREVELLRVNGQWYLEAIRPKGSDQIAFTHGMFF
jgi:hypothetical protein